MLLILGDAAPSAASSRWPGPLAETLAGLVGKEGMAFFGAAVEGRAPPGWSRAAIVHCAGGGTAAIERLLEQPEARASLLEGLEPESAGVIFGEPVTRRFGAEARVGDRVLCVVFSNPVEGHEAEYHAWYDERHIPDVLSVPGYLTAQRFRVSAKPGLVVPPWRWFAFYEIAADAYDSAVAEVGRRTGTPQMPISPAASRPVSAHYTPEPPLAR